MPHQNPPVPAEISLLPPAAADDPVLVTGLTDLVNQVYAVAEEGLWADGTARTSVAEIAALVGAGEIAVARLSGEIVGSVRVRRVPAADGDLGEFGMLVTAPAHRGAGTGRRLIDFAESHTRAQGLTTMQLELLVPQTWTHPAKAMLHKWYTRLGYSPTGTHPLADSHPHLAGLLATPCDVHVYRKPLG
ncbi:GNAT family N-acetyltransferase [Sphaerisporangium aureirubrum]|uniref:GNAT family N-acetyltransferase n=1 Tax=Sphaerisporangium aureirubrum TaxID=1544736 RepID=A0ABW1NQR0_9ACTN